MSVGEPVVSCRSLTKRYGDVVAVDGVSFSLEPGTVTGFLGPNGAGKTTTLRLLLGLAEPTAGEALVFGRRYRELEQPLRRVGAVLESSDYHPSRSGRNHLRCLALAAELPLSRVEEVLELVELERGGRPPRTHLFARDAPAAGRRRRAARRPGAVDSRRAGERPRPGRRPLAPHASSSELAAEGRTVLVSSHLLAEVAQTVDHVVIIDHGRLLAQGRLDELTAAGRRSRTSTSS